MAKKNLPVARIGDTNTHGAAAITGSPNVFVNMIPVHRRTDFIAPHDSKPVHTGVIALGSITVFANKLGVARILDFYTGSCGGQVAKGSPNVFAGPIGKKVS